jgi:hypothetical protein
LSARVSGKRFQGICGSIMREEDAVKNAEKCTLGVAFHSSEKCRRKKFSHSKIGSGVTWIRAWRQFRGRFL